MNHNQNPQLTAVALANMAMNDEMTMFIGNAISVYFKRVMHSSPAKLAKYGLRPIISPVAAEDALRRVQHVEYSEAWLHALIANDAEVAALAWRGVQFYAKRYAEMDLTAMSEEVGEVAMTLKDTARLITLALDAGSHQSE
ncbi:hypothetical protein ACLPHM_02840 [Paenalcaligenes sp. Me131]|uniref:hypothetical protein n=1 Tax=Paenalcaligenes sp. Me131 TaxID=3392636 RepID=UPI003D2A69B3